MSPGSKIFLFSKTPYPDPGVKHIQILQTHYFQPQIDFSAYDYIIATSKEVFAALDRIGSWKGLPVLAISHSTAQSATEAGAKILDTADGYGESIAEIINEKYTNLKALYPHAKVIAYDLLDALLADALIDSFIVYETECSKEQNIDLPPDAVCVFSSPSSVKCFGESYLFLPTYKIVCIGETTRSALPKSVEAIVADKTSIESAVECAKKLLE